MIRQKGYINLDGFFAIIAGLAIFGVFGIFSLFYWGIPSLWIWIKPLLHMASA